MTKIIKLPGLVDAHVHLRDPGASHKEDFYSGTCAALAGGVVALVDMPNNPRPTTSVKALKEKILSADQKCVCDYGFYFGADKSNWNFYDNVAQKTLGLKIYLDHTTGPLLLENLEALENHFRRWPNQRPILVHAEDSNLAKAVGLAAVYKKWLHVCHVSQVGELDLIKQAKRTGIKITCEVTPHHLFLTKREEGRLGSLALMRPTLKTKTDQEALWQGIKNGLVDYIASDHAPHTIEEKKSANPPFGVPGLETTLPLMLTAVWEKRLTIDRLSELLSLNPAKLLKITLPMKTYIEVDMDKKWVINNKEFKTKCGWSPFAGRQVKGKLVRVFIRGKKVYEDGQVLVKKGFGKLLK